MQGHRPTGAAMQASASQMMYQNRLPGQSAPAPAQLHHQTGSNPSQMPTHMSTSQMPSQIAAADALKVNSHPSTGATSAPLQVPVADQLASSQSSGMTHSEQVFPGSRGPPSSTTYATSNGLAVRPYGTGVSSQHGHPYAAGGNQGMSAYTAEGMSSYSRTNQRAGTAGMPEGAAPIQSGGIARAGAGMPYSSGQALQRQYSGVDDDRPSVVASQPGSPGLNASANQTSTADASPVANSQPATQQIASAATADEIPVKSQSNEGAKQAVLDKSMDAQSNGNQQAETSAGLLDNDAHELDVLADAPQLIEPPMLVGQDSFSNGLFAD